jgi:hypothetical protein
MACGTLVGDTEDVPDDGEDGLTRANSALAGCTFVEEAGSTCRAIRGVESKTHPAEAAIVTILKAMRPLPLEIRR